MRSRTAAAPAAAASPAEGLASDVNESLRAATDRVEAARRAQQRARAAVDAEATPPPPPSRRPPPIPEEEEAGGELAVTPRRTGGRRSSGPLYSAGGTATQSYVPFAVPPRLQRADAGEADGFGGDDLATASRLRRGAGGGCSDAGDTADAAVLDASLPGGSQLVSPGLSVPAGGAAAARRTDAAALGDPLAAAAAARKDDDDERVDPVGHLARASRARRCRSARRVRWRSGWR